MESFPVPLRKLYTSTLKMACPFPHAAARPASHVIHIHFARIEGLLIDRERRRHRDAALVRERVGVRPESHVETQPAESQPPAKPKLEPLALVPRHATSQHPDANPLLTTDVHDAAASRVQDIRAERRVADRVREV